jgi:hypothetical protein
MTTSTSTREVPVAGTPFTLVPLPVLWDDHSVLMVGDFDAGDSRCFDHGLGCSCCDFYFGPWDELMPDDLPCMGVGDCEPAVVWGLTAPGCPSVEHCGGRVRVWTPLLWRLEDGEYLARQLYGACPDPWRIGSDWLILPDPVVRWLNLVEPLLNRGLPQALLVGCKEYVEAADRQ